MYNIQIVGTHISQQIPTTVTRGDICDDLHQRLAIEKYSVTRNNNYYHSSTNRFPRAAAAVLYCA